MPLACRWETAGMHTNLCPRVVLSHSVAAEC